MKTATLDLPIFKQGDDVAAIQEQDGDLTPGAVLRRYADRLLEAASRLKKVADIISTTPVTLEGQAHVILLHKIPADKLQLLKSERLIEDE